MKAIGVKDKDTLVEFNAPKPVPEKNDLLVNVKAVSINPVDCKRRAVLARGGPGSPLQILGWDAAGIVEAVGSGVTLFKPGDAVFYAGDVNRNGSNAEYQVVDERIVGKMPNKLAFEEAAAVPLTALTAWEVIFERLRIHKDEQNKTVLIIGGAGGVGSIATQLLKRLTRCTVIATASRPESIDWCKKMGADETADHTNLIDSVKRLGIEYFDYIFNFNNVDQYWQAMCSLVRPFGRIGCIIPPTKEINIQPLFSKSVSISFELMFTRSTFKTDDMVQQHWILNEVSALYDMEVLKPVLNKLYTGFSAENFQSAHNFVQSGKAVGKVGIKF